MKRAVLIAGWVPACVLVFAQISPAQSCVWRPWMSDWGKLNDYSPPDDLDPTNWDFAGVQPTVLDGDGRAHTGSFALHFFSGDPVVPGGPSERGSGGVYQEFMAVRGTPINVNLWWKGKTQSATPGGWFEVLIVEGPFTTQKADNGPPNAGDIILKYDTFDGPPWGPPPATWKNDTANWNRWSTTTPAEPTVVTVILKAGSVGTEPCYFEAYYDDVIVSQNGGPNLVVNGDFEDAAQVPVCDSLPIAQDPDRSNYYFLVPPAEDCGNGVDDDEDGQTDCDDSDCAESKWCVCNDPAMDTEPDGDVDGMDFAAFQRCITIGGGEVAPECACFDRPEEGFPEGDGDVDDVDLTAFLLCDEGPGVIADPACDN